MDLTESIRWAGDATTPGTAAHDAVRAGLRSLFHVDGNVNITNPVSSARDGVIPDLTRVLVCRLAGQTVCVKLYPGSSEGRTDLEKHAFLLSRLRRHVPVPAVLGVCLDTDPFGFPALVTTATGRPLDRELHGLGEAAQARIVTSVARAVAALHGLAPQELGIAQSYDPASVLRTWQCDAAWYENHADQAGATADVVRAAALVLAGRAQAPSAGCVVHRDLTPYNILAGDGTFAALVDWDHAGFSARQEDVGKAVIGLLGMLAIPRERRIPLASTFLRSYAGASSLPDEELYEQCVPFALDTILDWIVGGKNAPREELAWATEQVMNAEGIQQRNRRRPR